MYISFQISLISTPTIPPTSVAGAVQKRNYSILTKSLRNTKENKKNKKSSKFKIHK